MPYSLKPLFTSLRTPQPWMIALASLLPGAGLFWLGKRKPGLAAGLVCLGALAWLVNDPSPAAAWLFGMLIFTQAAAGVVLAIWIEPAQEDSTGVAPGALSPSFLPSPLVGEQALFRARVAGFDPNLRQSQVLAATKTDLVLAPCDAEGAVLGIDSIPRSNVFWVTLEIWRQHCMLMVEFYDNQRPPIILALPRQAEERAKGFLAEFDGILLYKIPTRAALQPLETDSVNIWDWFILFAGLGLFMAGVLLPGGTLNAPRVWALAAGSLLFFWPLLLLGLRGVRSLSS